MPAIEIVAINRYPVKGLSADPLDQATITAGDCLMGDRAYAIEAGSGKFDPADPAYLPKINFLMLMRHARLARLDARFDAETHMLTLFRDGGQVARGKLNERTGRQIIEQFLSAFMEDEMRGSPRIVSAPGHHFTDAPAKTLSVLNLASVRDLERVTGHPLDPLRFRANIHIDGPEPWAEFGWLDRTIEVGGTALFEVRSRIDRCAATDVDPKTGARDTSIPRTLIRAFGHGDMGIYVAAIADGEITVGDELVVT